MPKLCFYGIFSRFFFRCPSVPERKAVRDRPCHEWYKPSWAAGKPVPYLTTQMNLSRQIRHTSLRMFARFHASGMGFFLFSVVSFRYGFLWGIFFSQYASASVYLHFRAFQLSASGGHSRSGRKGNSGIVRKCKVKPPVFGENLQPCG